ncbi:stress response translation initiation inhibitor YciH [Candidatus Woesearchaeota archaeon CG10_big_fil_rev_8_21_14_0_10_44_13]|nr:MAG: stress response translation initiation inhibitor YciH [Candidatus Woesearchaeota archaeon CG10_big_fil_rev_8_21_14_0_10_44_13]
MTGVCATCGLPKELCVCESIAKESQRIVVKTEDRKFNKTYTVIEGIDEKEVNMRELMKNLKSKLACGGAAKGGKIELQGDHKHKAKAILVQMGFAPETIEIR